MSESREKVVPDNLQAVRQRGGLGPVFCCYFWISSNIPRSQCESALLLVELIFLVVNNLL